MSATSDDGASADETQILSASSVAENSKLTSELMYLNIRHHKVGQGCRRRNRFCNDTCGLQNPENRRDVC